MGGIDGLVSGRAMPFGFHPANYENAFLRPTYPHALVVLDLQPGYIVVLIPHREVMGVLGATSLARFAGIARNSWGWRRFAVLLMLWVLPL